MHWIQTKIYLAADSRKVTDTTKSLEVTFFQSDAEMKLCMIYFTIMSQGYTNLKVSYSTMRGFGYLL
jgi:hypothetical protein